MEDPVLQRILSFLNYFVMQFKNKTTTKPGEFAMTHSRMRLRMILKLTEEVELMGAAGFVGML